jgi:ElaB/YqjD/DUF883 family membrane-anchored ribosome-binding protein
MENPLKKSDIDVIAADVEKLKKDLAKAMEHLKTATVNGAVNGATNLSEYVTDEAAALYKTMAKKSERATKALNKHVEEQPMTSLLIAFTAGFFLSRLTDRR